MVALEGQAGEFGSILTDAKEPAARSLEAAQAYDNIAKAMAEADERAQEARNDAEASPNIRPRHACMPMAFNKLASSIHKQNGQLVHHSMHA